MKTNLGRRKLNKLLLAFSVGLALLFVVLKFGFAQIQQPQRIYDLVAKSEDGQIRLSWQMSAGTVEQILLTITSETGSEQALLEEGVREYVFSRGQHGKRYDFSLQFQNEPSAQAQISALFLQWDQLPDIPLLSIQTANGEKPTNDNVKAPSGSFGVTAVNNFYSAGEVTLTQNGTLLVHREGEIRVRGNTSSMGEKKPNQLKFNKPVDLLCGRQGDTAARKWVLLATGTSLNLPVGTEVARLCGLEWQPKFMLVNLMINGDWQGCYWIVETVERAPNKIDIDESGFLIESDAYWWAEDVYIQTAHTGNNLAYTLKYPRAEDIGNGALKRLTQYLELYEKAFYAEDDTYLEYIDIESFAAWLLMHDILGSGDGAGTNVYFHKKTLDKANDLTSKMTMGVAWDFDSAFSRSGKWSDQRARGEFVNLLQKKEFLEAYSNKWWEMSGTFRQELGQYMEESVMNHMDEIQKSWDLDAQRWNREAMDVSETVIAVNQWMNSRTAFLNKRLG